MRGFIVFKQIATLLIFTLFTITANASVGGGGNEGHNLPEVNRSGPVKTTKTEQPVLRAIIISIAGEGSIAAITGHAFLSRASGEYHKSLSVGDRIKVGDLLELEKSASVRLRDQQGNLIDLSGEEGPWFKVDGKEE
jgi:hypothetical protein